MVEEPARRAHSSHKQRLERKASEYTLGPHFVLALVRAPFPSLQCHVCRFLTGAQARSALLRLVPFLFPFETVHRMLVVHCLSH